MIIYTGGGFLRSLRPGIRTSRYCGSLCATPVGRRTCGCEGDDSHGCMSDGAVPCHVAGMPHKAIISFFTSAFALSPQCEPVQSQSQSFTAAEFLPIKLHSTNLFGRSGWEGRA